MLSSYVCRQCRTRLLHRGTAQIPRQWQPRATFISLRNARGEPAENTPAAARQPDVESSETANPAPPATVPSSAPRPSRYAKHLLSPEEQEQADSNPVPRAVPIIHTLVDSRREIGIWQTLDRRDVNGAWGRFVEATSKENGPSLADNSELLQRLLDSIVKAFCKGETVAATPTAALFRFHQLGLASGTLGDSFKDIIHGLTAQLLLLVSRVRSGATEEAEKAEKIMAELLSIWRLLFQCKRPEQASFASIDTEWQSLPDVATLNPAFMPRSLVERLQAHHPKLIGTPGMAFSAVYIFSALTQPSSYGIEVSKDLQSVAKPFVTFMAHILPGGNVDSIQKEHLPRLKRLPEDFQKTINEMVRNAPLDAKTLLSPSREEYLIKRIARSVLEQSHKKRLDDLWKEAVRAYRVGNDKTEIPPKVYNEFLTGYLALAAPERAVEVWNHMIGQGVKPDVKTWTATFAGCVKARDIDGLKGMWDRMIRSGIQPDNFAWTTRINGLLSNHAHNHALKDGFAALDEMGRLWLAAQQAAEQTSSKKKKAATPNEAGSTAPSSMPTKPSVEVVNAAASGITKSRKMYFDTKVQYVNKILQWAGSFDIKPDAQTYNILMQMYINGGDYNTTFKLLKQMEKNGIEHDMATYSMLFRASFDNQKFSGMTPEQQTESVFALFSDLEASGLKPNTYIYSIAIDRLLKQYGNYTAVRAIVEHMLSLGLQPNPHIYTSLVTHYFQQSPPDIAAVDALWFRLMNTNGIATDRVLFDRIIEGYAANGEVGMMMAVLTQMSIHGKLPGWVALTSVVKALADAGDWERAQNVVRDVQDGEGVAKGGITGNKHGQEEFWDLVEQLGIMKEDAGISKRGWEEQAFERVAEEQRPKQSEPVGGVLVDAPKQAVAPKPAVAPEQEWEDNGNIGGVPL